MKKEIKGILFWLEKYIIFGISLFFAVLIVGLTVVSEGWIYIILAVPLVIVNFFLAKKFPARFIPWSRRTKTDSYKAIFAQLGFAMITSTALIVFVFHFFDPLAKEIWSVGLDFLPEIMNEAGMRIFALFIFLPVLIALCFLTFYGILKLLKKKTEIDCHKSLFYLTVAISTILYTYLLAKLIDATVGNEIIDYSGKAISIIVGFIPIHWAYEIFVGSLFKKIN